MSTQFSQLCDLVKDQCDPSTSGATVYIGLEHITSSSFFMNRFGNPEDVTSSKGCFKKGDILYGKLRPYLDKAVIATTEGICSTDILILRPRLHVSPAFLLGLIHSNQFIEHAVATTHGVNHPRTSWNSLAKFSLELPEVMEQEKIAALLWKVQSAIDVEEKLIAASRDLKQSAMHRLFTRGLYGSPAKITDVGEMPQNWKIEALGALGKIGNGSTPKRTTQEYWKDGVHPWLTSSKIHEGTINKSDELVTSVALKECHLPIVKAGSVLIAITGQGKTLGNSAIVTFDTCISQHLAYVQFSRNDVEPMFVRYFLQSRYDHLRQIAHGGGSTKGALTCAFLKTYPIPFPSLEEQKEIAHVLDVIDQKILMHQKKSGALQEFFQVLSDQLITGQIRVSELDINTSEITF